MKLTCVTAVFNAVKSGNRENLIRCVKSVAALKTEHEHLVFDGASTDGTVELLRDLERTTPGLKVVSEPDTGIYNALNKGVRNARGQWLSVLGCDDYYSRPDVLDSILSNDCGKNKLIIAQVDRDYGYRFFTCKRDLKTIFCGVPCAHMGMLMDVSMVRRLNGFDESLKIGADQDLFFKMMEAEVPFEVVYRAFANFAHGGASAQDEAQAQRDLWENFRRHLHLTDSQLELFKSKGFHSPHVMVPLLRSPNWIFRQGARYMLWIMFRYYLRFALYPVVILRHVIRSRCVS